MSPTGYAVLAYVVGLGLMGAYGVRVWVLSRGAKRRADED